MRESLQTSPNLLYVRSVVITVVVCESGGKLVHVQVAANAPEADELVSQHGVGLGPTVLG